jgi:hypothetical protein
MKIAIIDKNIDSTVMCDAVEFLAEELDKMGIQSDITPNYRVFQQRFVSLDRYQGALLHLGIDSQDILKNILDKYKNMKIGLLTYQPEDYEFEIPVFSYRRSAQDIKEWLENTEKS